MDSIEIVRGDVFDTVGGFGAIGSILNNFHAVTKESVIEHELFILPGDTVTQNDLDEIERNMRTLDVFSTLFFEVIPVEGEEGEKVPLAKLRVITRDKWSLLASGSVQIGPSEESYILSAREVNLLGYAQQIGVVADYTTVNDRKWRFSGHYLHPNISGEHLRLGLGAGSSKHDKSGLITFGLPFYSDRSLWAFNVAAAHSDGDSYFYLHGLPENRFISSTSVTDAAGWYGRARGGPGDVFRTSIQVTYNRTVHDSILAPARAFDNTVGVFGGISSIRRRYTHIDGVDFSGLRQVPIGAMGSVTLGKISPHNGGLDNAAYIGVEARQAVRYGDFYAFGSIATGTGLAGKQAQFTIERFLGTAVYKLDPGAFVARVEQSTVWNWPRYIFMATDNRNGLRGYELYEVFGDNKLLFNLEYRLHPIFSLIGHDIGLTAFYDVGGIWDQGEDFFKTRFLTSAGLGVRISASKGLFNKAVLRVDVAYNFEDRKISRLIVGSQEAFDAFGSIDYSPPAPIVP